MKDVKPFFYRIDISALFDFATEPEGMSMTLLQFCKELQRGKSDIPYIQGLVEETRGFIAKKAAAGKKGMENRWLKNNTDITNDNSDITVLSSDITNDNTPVTRSSNSTEAVTITAVETEDLKSKKTLSGNKKPDAIPYQKICDSMNLILGTRYQNVETFKRLVRARINEGFTPDDFEVVCRNKFREWGTDLKMMAYLRPDTLFSPKMNSYIGGNVVEPDRPRSDRELINKAAGDAFERGEI